MNLDIEIGHRLLTDTEYWTRYGGWRLSHGSRVSKENRRAFRLIGVPDLRA